MSEGHEIKVSRRELEIILIALDLLIHTTDYEEEEVEYRQLYWKLKEEGA